VKDRENQNTIKLHAEGNITCNNHWTIHWSRMLKYSITNLVNLQYSWYSACSCVWSVLHAKHC
jgi:hypothetical protein